MSINKAKAVSDLLGLGTGGAGLQRLTIEREGGDPVEALFNPGEISVSAAASWEQSEPASYGGANAATIALEFRSVQAQTLSVELFFDTYESRASMTFTDAALALLPATSPGSQATDVSQYTEQVAQLAEVDPTLHRPPVCHLYWGAFDIFTGVLTSLDQRFTLFLDDGTPVRATLSCSFLGVSLDWRGKGEPESSDVIKTRQVRRNDTLQSIAGEEYKDPSLWRNIATANGIINPRDVQPGTVLIIPSMQP
jgi:nucleoid-associated protein YgaU